MRYVIIVLASAYIVVAWIGLIYIIRRGLGPYFHSKRQPHTKIPARIKHKIGHEDFHPINWETDLVSKTDEFEVHAAAPLSPDPGGVRNQ